MTSLRIWIFLPLLLLALSGTARAERSWAEISRETEIAQKAIMQAQKEISAAEGKVQEAIDKVQSAERFEGPHWVVLEQAMKDYSDTFGQRMGVVDNNVKRLLQLNPSASIPTINVEPPQFKASIKSLEAVRDELQRTVMRAKTVKAARMQDDAKIRLEMEQRTEEAYWDVANNLAGIPLNGDGSINYGDLITKFLPSPVGLINTGMSITFGLYFYADEMKSGVRQIKTFKQMIAYADEAIAKGQANVASAEQGLQFLNGYWQQKEELMKQFYKLRNGWGAAADQSRKSMKEEETKEFDQALAKPHYPPQFGNWDPPMQASEIEGEARSAIQELESAALAAMQGGDPDNFAAVIARYHGQYKEKMNQAERARKTAADAFQQVWQTYMAATDAAYKAYAATIRGHCTCERDFFEAASRSYQAACNSAYAATKPAAAALNKAERERARIGLVAGMISTAADTLGNQLVTYAQAAQSSLNMRIGQAFEAVGAASSDLGALSYAIPDSWNLDAIKNYVAGLDDYVSNAFYWGTDPSTLQTEVQSYADSVRTLGQRTRKAVPEYKKIQSEVIQLTNTLKSDINQALDKDAMLMASSMDGSLQYMRWPWFDGTAWVRTNDQRKEYLESIRRYFERDISFQGREDLDKVAGFNFEDMASRIEEKARYLDDLAGRISIFNFRLANVSAGLDKVSRKLTGQGIRQARTKAAETLVNEELTTGAWGGLMTNVDAILKQLEPIKQPGYPYFVNSQAGARPRILAAQNILYVAAQYKMRNFLTFRQNNSFSPVPAQDFKLLDDAWTQLKPLYGQFDAQAAAARGPLTALQKEIPDTTKLSAAYSSIPERMRGLVAGPYQGYLGEDRYVRSYLNTKLEALEPLSDTSRNNVLGNLQEWIGGYPALEKAWREEVARQQREAEERQRRYEEEQKKREEERKQKAAGELTSVQSLYANFAAAYQSRNLNAVVSFLAPDWQTDQGTTRFDLEDTLSNSFRVFDTVTFTISGLQVRPLSESVFQASYSTHLVGHIRRLNIKHEEKSSVVDTVIVTPDGPRIKHTSGGSFWLK